VTLSTSGGLGARDRLEAAFAREERRGLMLAWSDAAGLLCFGAVIVSQRAARIAGAMERA
jgi:hypothetical protein